MVGCISIADDHLNFDGNKFKVYKERIFNLYGGIEQNKSFV